MEMSGSQHIPASKEKVWEALNDPEILQACIPGCKTLEATGENGFEATVQAKVGPVKANFKGAVTLSDIDAPNGYTISGEGKGGAAGFAKGGAKVSLEDQDGGTLLSYEVDANVGGKLAQIGSRLIDSTAKKMAADFFEKFSEELLNKYGGTPAVPETPAPSQAEQENVKEVKETKAEETPKHKENKEEDKMVPILGLHPFVWTIGLVGVVIALIFGFSG